MKSTIRPVHPTDTPWITFLLKEGARQKHFSPTVADQASDIVRAVLKENGVVMEKNRNGIKVPRFISAEILVVEVEGTPASFMLSLHDNDEVELHLSSTKNQHRKKGYFSDLVRHKIDNEFERKKIYARCYKKSSWAISAFKKLGFEITQDGNPIELTFKRKPM